MLFRSWKPLRHSFRLEGVQLYRTLSNFWIFDDSLIQWAFDGTQRALEFVEKGNTIDVADGYRIQRCINTNNTDDFDFLKAKFAL